MLQTVHLTLGVQAIKLQFLSRDENAEQQFLMVFGNNWSYFIHNFFDIRQISDGSSELFFSMKKKAERVWGELKMHYESNKFHSCLCNPPLTIVILLSSDFFSSPLCSHCAVFLMLLFLLSLLVHHLLSLLAVNLSKSCSSSRSRRVRWADRKI